MEDSARQTRSAIEFKSTRTVRRLATKNYIRGSLIFDLGWLGLLWQILLPWKAEISLALTFLWIPLAFLLRFTFHRIRLRTPGDILWALAREFEHGHRAATLQVFRRTPFQIAAFTVLTVGSLQGGLILTYYRATAHPSWVQMEVVRLGSTFPTTPPTAGSNLAPLQWKTLPLYFALGSLPVRYEGEPVFHTLPYKKGPPVQFLDAVVARWRSPSTVAIYEGPKTADTKLNRDQIRECLTKGKLLPPDFRCQKVQEQVLSRHLSEINLMLPGTATHPDFIRWFEVTHPRLSRLEQSEGIVLVSTHQGLRHERRIFISPGGIQQTFILKSKAEDLRAIQVFDEAMRSMRIHDEIQAGRLWADDDVASIDLAQLPPPSPGNPESSRERIQRIADFQATLFGKLSVDPSALDAYYHLGGLSALLLDTPQSTPWSAAPSQLLAVLPKYAADISPQDRKTLELERMARRIQAK